MPTPYYEVQTLELKKLKWSKKGQIKTNSKEDLIERKIIKLKQFEEADKKDYSICYPCLGHCDQVL